MKRSIISNIFSIISQIYVRILLTPLYEELGPIAIENEEKWKDNLRSLARTFLCRAGYRPCIEEAQIAYHKWMDSENPNEGNPYVQKTIKKVYSDVKSLILIFLNQCTKSIYLSCIQMGNTRGVGIRIGASH